MGDVNVIYCLLDRRTSYPRHFPQEGVCFGRLAISYDPDEVADSIAIILETSPRAQNAETAAFTQELRTQLQSTEPEAILQWVEDKQAVWPAPSEGVLCVANLDFQGFEFTLLCNYRNSMSTATDVRLAETNYDCDKHDVSDLTIGHTAISLLSRPEDDANGHEYLGMYFKIRGYPIEILGKKIGGFQSSNSVREQERRMLDLDGWVEIPKL